MGPKGKYLSFLILIPFAFSSCALLLNATKQKIRVLCDSSLQLVSIDNRLWETDSLKKITLTAGEAPNFFELACGNKPITLHFRLADSSLVDYHRKSGLSREFLIGNCYPLFSVGYFVNLFSHRRFSYPAKSYFSYDHREKEITRSGILPVSANYLRMNIGWSFANCYHNSLVSHIQGQGSPFGIQLQLEYFFTKRQSVYFEAGTATMFVGKSPSRRNYGRLDDVDSIVSLYTTCSWIALGYRFGYRRLSFGAAADFAGFYVTNQKYFITQARRLSPTQPEAWYP